MAEEQQTRPTSPSSTSATSRGSTTESSPSQTGTTLPEPTAPDNKLVQSVEAALGPEVGPEPERARIAQRIAQKLVAEYYRGPLPHPRHLKAFEDACPGAGNRILAMAEKAQERQEARLDRALDYENQERRVGLDYGLYGLIALLITGIVVIALGQVEIGGGLLGATLLGRVITTFVHGRPKEPQSPTPPGPPVAGGPQPTALPAPPRKSFWQRFLSIFSSD
jgi:uncharacterized membrane protein